MLQKTSTQTPYVYLCLDPVCLSVCVCVCANAPEKAWQRTEQLIKALTSKQKVGGWERGSGH